MDKKLKLSEKVIYVWGYIMFPLELTLTPTINIDGQEFFAKKEFHVSLLCTKDYVPKLAKQLQKSEDEALKILLDKTRLALKKFPLEFDSFSDEILKVGKKNKKTLVVPVKMNGLKEIFEFMSKEIEIPIEIPPTHITLFTLENGLSIGLNSRKDLLAYSKELDKESRDIVKKSIKS